MAIREAFRRWRERGSRYLFGRDFFISYSRRDATGYAAALANRLAPEYSSYLDQLALPRGEALPPPIKREVQRASVLALVGSAGALESAYVAEEIQLFLATGRPILLIDAGGALEHAPWQQPPWSQLTGVFRKQESLDALHEAKPGDPVVAYLGEAFAFARQDRRLRNASRAALLLLATVVGVAAIVTIVTTRWANDAAQRAADQERIATSRRLAGESSSALGRQPDVAIQLAANAFQSAPTADAWRALFDSLTHYPRLRHVVRPDAPGEIEAGFAVSADGRRFVTVVEKATVWDASTLRPVATLEAEDLDGFAISRDGTRLALGHKEYVALIDWSTNREVGRVPTPSADTVVFVSPSLLATARDNLLEIWNVADAARPASIERVTLDSEVTALAADPNGLDVLAVATQQSVFVCPVPECQRQRSPLAESKDGGFQVLALASDPESEKGYLAALNNFTGRMVVWSSEGERIIDLLIPMAFPAPTITRSEGLDLFTLALSNDGERVAIGSLRGRLIVSEMEQLEAESQLFGAANADLALRDAERLEMQTEGGGMRQIEYPPGVVGLAFVSDASRVLVGQFDGSLSLWDSENHLAIEQRRPLPATVEQSMWKATFSEDGRYLLNESIDGSLTLTDMAKTDATVALESAFAGRTSLTAMAPDGAIIAALGPNSAEAPSQRTLAIWDRSGRLRSRTVVDSNAAGGLDKQPSPETLAIGTVVRGYDVVVSFNDGTVLVFNSSQSPARLVNSRVFDGSQVALSPSSPDIAIVGSHGATLWNSDRGTIRQLPGAVSYGKALTYTADGRGLLVFHSEDTRIEVVRWDLATGGEPSRWVLVQDSNDSTGMDRDGVMNPTEVAISPDGQVLAIANDRTVALWHLGAHVRLASFDVTEKVDALAFANGGETLLAPFDEGVYSLEVGGSQLVRLACIVAPRAFTPAEQQRYFDGGAAAFRCEP